jgi:hypothetical protein
MSLASEFSEWKTRKKRWLFQILAPPASVREKETQWQGIRQNDYFYRAKTTQH